MHSYTGRNSLPSGKSAEKWGHTLPQEGIERHRQRRRAKIKKVYLDTQEEDGASGVEPPQGDMFPMSSS